MITRIRRPGPPLSGFVDWLWFHEGLLCDHRRERVLPDGTFELVITERGEYLNFVPIRD